MKKTILALLAGVLFLLPAHLRAQRTAIKSNALYWGALAPNLGLEFYTGQKTTFDLEGAWNPFSFSNKQKTYKLWLVQPEFRYWFCESFNGGFVGVHAHGGEFNVGGISLPFGLSPALKEYRYDGYYYGAGASIGKHWILSDRWSMEGVIGLGYARLIYDKYRCAECSPVLKSGKRNYWGPTKAAVSFIYLIK